MGTRQATLVALLSLACAGIVKAQPAPSLPSPETSDDPAAATIARALKPTGPATLAKEAVAEGQDLMVIPVTYAVTGTLRSDVKDGAMWGITIPTRRPIPAGTPVFAVATNLPTGIAPDPKLMWCAAMIPPQPDTETFAANWTVTCFARVFGHTRFVDMMWDRFPLGDQAQLGSIATTPEIDEAPIDLHPGLRVVVQFSKWDDSKIKLRLLVREPVYSPLLGHGFRERDKFILTRPIGPDGAAHIRLFGEELAVRPAAAGSAATAEIVSPAAP